MSRFGYAGESTFNYNAINAIQRQTFITLKFIYQEMALREMVKQAAGQWHQEDKVWLLPHYKVMELNLSKRIVEKICLNINMRSSHFDTSAYM